MVNKSKNEYLAGSESDLPRIARKLLSQYPDHRIFAISGLMGTGKTTFIKALCRELGVVNQALSPTFAIINEYRRPDQSPVYHFDFFRIDKMEELYDIGYEEYFFSGHYCFLEWPELAMELIPPEAVHVTIAGETDRVITF